MTSYMMQHQLQNTSPFFDKQLSTVDSMNKDFDYLFKFILVGQSSVGKSCLLLRFLQSRFKNQHQPTLGVQFGARAVHIDDRKIKLQVWDTAGQQSFRSITRAYYRGSIAALLVFDLTSLASFNSLSHWLKEVRTNSHTKLRLCLIGNKLDLKSERQVPESSIQEFIKTNNIAHYYQTSALSGENCDNPFLEMGGVVLKAIDQGSIKPQQDGAMGVKTHSRNSPKVIPSIRSLTEIREKQLIKQREREKCAC